MRSIKYNKNNSIKQTKPVQDFFPECVRIWIFVGLDEETFFCVMGGFEAWSFGLDDWVAVDEHPTVKK